MAASTSTSDQWFEVFINHRGVDVKKTFAKDLYKNLRSIGLRAFLDEEELHQGYGVHPQIKHAIGTSSAHVAIFSKRYAESTYCLDELVMMLDSKKPIIPVFYGVTTEELQWTQGDKGEYARALQKLAEETTHDTLENWRNALYCVAEISGFVLQESDIGEEVEVQLLDKLVKRLSEMLKKPDFLVADYPAGLDDKLKHFEDTVLLQLQQSRKPQITGIAGLGGLGKTTFAKHFFNRKNSDYHRSCILFEVKDSSLKSLQSQLLKNLTGNLDKEVDSVEGGKVMLRDLLKSTKVLVILDDVDHENQVKALLPVQTDDVDHEDQVKALLPVDLHTDSLILIISRNKDVLKKSRVVEESSIYELATLNPQHSRELFCSYAFSQSCPAREFESLVAGFLEACKGLPLSLKVFGALLYGRDISDWVDELGSLQQILPDEIHETFMISYNSLNEEEQQIFLDIACFFIGEKKDTAISIWHKSDWRGRRGFQNLQNKCLVEVDSRNRIHMHDHVRDLRIKLAEDMSPRLIWRWTKNVLDYKLLSEPEIPVRGIRIVHGEHKGDDKDNAFDLRDYEIARLERIFRRLRFLDAENAAENAVLERILRRVELPDVIWLRWENCPHSSLPSWVPLKNLRFLQVSKSLLNTLWQREGELERSLQLPVCLEELIAVNCVNLKSIPGLEQLKQLRLLHVSGCSELEELPSMKTLQSLEELYANGCVKLKSIRGLAHCTELRKLDVSGCSKLEELPSMERLRFLEEFVARGRMKLKSIRGLAHCTKLRILVVSGCSELEELPSMETLQSLESLFADGCEKLKSIRGLAHCTKLRELAVGWSELEELPSMETLQSLERLFVDQCSKLERIPGLGQCTKLRELDVSWCYKLEELPSMKTLVSLEKLCADHCMMKSIPGLAQCTKLRELDVNCCDELEELPSMEACISLEVLGALGCTKLKRIQGVEQCTKLRRLNVSWCDELEELPSMEACISLEELCAENCVKLKRIRGVALCTELRTLDVGGCSELEELPSMKACISLEKLCAENCVKLKRIRGVAQCTELRKLDVGGCSELEELPSMEACISLEKLCAENCVKLKRIRGMVQCTKLKKLDVGGCSELEELPSMEAYISLEKLCAKNCVKLKRIRGVAQCRKLRKLDVGGCSELEEVEGVEDFRWWEMLDVSGCPKLQCPVWE